MPLNRTTLGLAVLTAFFLLAALFAILIYSLAPASPAARGPILLTAFIVILVGGLLCILFFLRWLLRPYRQLVGEAERAPVAAHAHKSRDEAQFVLETFQSVLAKLQVQQKELEFLSAREAERADSAERFSERIVASVPSGLLAFDGNGRSIVINTPGRELLEINGDVEGQSVIQLLGNLPQLAEIVDQCLQTGRLFRREEIEATSESGETRRIGATVAPIDLASERGRRGALCLLTDITEVTHLREEVALKRNLESLGEMSAGLAHEFKNAIATLHGYVQLLQTLPLDDRGQAATGSLLGEVRSLSDMVTSFLNFARPQPLDLEETSLPDLIRECIAELQPLYEQHRVTLELQLAAESITIRADERMLRQTLLNLLRNAAEAISDDESERRVTVSVALQPDAGRNRAAVVTVSDTGQGIPTTDLQRIFIPFFTTKATGHGVGLALAHRVVAQHGGSLTAGNSSAGGAVFTIRLPC